MVKDKDFDEVMEESGMTPKEKPKAVKQTSYTDAPASVTYSIKTKTGFNCLFSIREESGVDLLDKMQLVETRFVTDGITPQPEKSYGAKKPVNIVPNRKCPLCGSDLVETTTSAGKRMIKCSTQRYDFATKTVQGCQFTEWL